MHHAGQVTVFSLALHLTLAMTSQSSMAQSRGTRRRIHRLRFGSTVTPAPLRSSTSTILKLRVLGLAVFSCR